MPITMRPPALALLSAALVAATVLAGCSSDDEDTPPDTSAGGGVDAPLVAPDGVLRATIRRTAGGVPHIRGDDLASVAYGAGFVQAEDNVCLIAEAVLKVRGERAAFLGPGEDNVNVTSDFSYRAIAAHEDTDGVVASLDPASRALLDGFAAGYNRYLADTAPGELPPACRDQPWVRAVTNADLYAYYRVVAQYASGDLFAEGAAVAAVPPGTAVRPRVVESARRTNGTEPLGALDPSRVGEGFERGAAATADGVRAFRDTGLGSNAWGIGRTLSASGRGALLANPHFPYSGPRRLYQMHLTVPGYYDVNGAALIGIPLPLTGFNRNLAWSHTVSAGRRFTLYELTLADDDPLVYVKDGERVAIESETIRVSVANGTDTPTLLEREVWFSEHGPMLAADLLTGGALPAWGDDGTAYAYRDANASAARLVDTWLGLGRAANLDAFRTVFDTGCGSTLWTNTTYADDAGNAFHIDSSSVPHLSDETLATLEARIAASDDFARLFFGGLTVLDGSTSRDDWVEGECGALVPYADKPRLVRDDFVQNSNSSHWLTNPAEPLTGFSPLFGDERFLVNARTQLGLRMLQSPTETGFATTAPAGQDGRFDARELLAVIWNDRALYAELWLPELRARCALIGGGAVTLPDGGERAVEAGCDVLAGWDGTYGIDSVGAHVFRVFLARLFAREDLDIALDTGSGEPSASNPPDDPANVTFTFGSAGRGTAEDQLLQSLASALEALDVAAIPYDATLGSVQSWTPSGGVPPGGATSAAPVALADPIPWHGGDGELDGAFNAIGVVRSPVAEDTRFPRLSPDTLGDTGGLSAAPGAGWAIGRGTSWHFGLEFTDAGPEAYGLVSYSQSTDPASPHFTDQSLLYSAKTPRRLLYDEADIAANVLPGGTRVLEGALGDPP